jgi:hypothetical protein
VHEKLVTPVAWLDLLESPHMNPHAGLIGLVALLAPLAAAATPTALPPAPPAAAVTWTAASSIYHPAYSLFSDPHFGNTLGSGASMPKGFDLAEIHAYGTPSPYVFGRATGGKSADGVLFMSSRGEVILDYNYIVHASSFADVDDLLNYMNSVSPLALPFAGDTFSRAGIGGVTYKGKTFVNVEDAPASSFGSAIAQVDIRTSLGSFDPFASVLHTTRVCSSLAPAAGACDSFDSSGDPVFKPFETDGSLLYEGGLDFFGHISLTVSAITGTSFLAPNDFTFTATSIIDPVISLSDAFTGDPSHFRIFLSEGLANGPAAPAGVPEPGAWVLLSLGLGMLGAALRGRRGRLSRTSTGYCNTVPWRLGSSSGGTRRGQRRIGPAAPGARTAR